MGTAQTRKLARRDLRKAVGEATAINVLELHRFLRRGFWGRMKWLLTGR